MGIRVRRSKVQAEEFKSPSLCKDRQVKAPDVKPTPGAPADAWANSIRKTFRLSPQVSGHRMDCSFLRRGASGDLVSPMQKIPDGFRARRIAPEGHRPPETGRG